MLPRVKVVPEQLDRAARTRRHSTSITVNVAPATSGPVITPGKAEDDTNPPKKRARNRLSTMVDDQVRTMHAKLEDGKRSKLLEHISVLQSEATAAGGRMRTQMRTSTDTTPTPGEGTPTPGEGTVPTGKECKRLWTMMDRGVGGGGGKAGAEAGEALLSLQARRRRLSDAGARTVTLPEEQRIITKTLAAADNAYVRAWLWFSTGRHGRRLAESAAHLTAVLFCVFSQLVVPWLFLDQEWNGACLQAYSPANASQVAGMEPLDWVRHSVSHCTSQRRGQLAPQLLSRTARAGPN
jgi:hypothetical protein